MSYEFREATSQEEIEQVRRLNHRAFAEELGQHAVSPDGRLVDPREAASRYFVALHGESVVGMVCASTTRPFSVESRLEDTAALDTLPGPLCEVRLLAIDAAHRNTLVISGLLLCLLRAVVAMGAGALLISGVTGRVEMYARLGFRPLGPAVTQGRAAFVPMALRLDELPPLARRGVARHQRRSS
jgi:predicted N-acetyltransferase YhbS